MANPTLVPIKNTDVDGVLHRPESIQCALVLAHGASSDRESAVLKSVAEALAEIGVAVLRINLPYRQLGKGPPRPAAAARDREGIERAAEVLRELTGPRVFLGGVSYGGRQSSMLAAEKPDVAAGLLLLSYPLHPPGQPEKLRTAHLPKLNIPALFVHGTKDPFGTIDELRAAIALIRGKTELIAIQGAGHDLRKPGVAAEAVRGFRAVLL